MGIHDQDTDPSTPSALSSAPTDPAQAPGVGGVPGPKASTDPGVGPPSQPHVNVTMKMVPPGVAAPPQPPPQQRAYPALGIVVPSSAPVGPKKDSVELLLEGMQGPQPERPRTTPATDGQSSASYHAEHLVRAARTSPDEEPKVVVDRPAQAPTTRIDRARVQSVIEQADALRRASEATVTLPQPMAPRMIVAIVAGVTVVLGMFLVFRIASRDTPRDDGGVAGAQAMPATPAAKPATTMGPGATPVTTTAATAATAPEPTATAAADTAPAAAAPARATAPSPAPGTPPAGPPSPARGAIPAVGAQPPPGPTTSPAAAPRATPPRGTAAPAGDVGEFKTTFH